MQNISSLIGIWPLVKEDLRRFYNENIYDNWLSGLDLYDFREVKEGKVLLLSVKNKFIQNWVVNNYLSDIRRILKVHIEDIVAVTIVEKLKEEQSQQELLFN